MTATRLFSRRFIRLDPADRSIDVAAFLEPRLSNRITHYLPVWAALLNEQGRVLFDFLVWPGGYGYLLDCEAAHAEELLEYLRPECAPAGITVSIDDGLGAHYRAYSGDGAASDPRHRALGQRWIEKISPDDESADKRWLECRLSLGIAEGRAELGFGELSWLQCNAHELRGVVLDRHDFPGRAVLLDEKARGVPERLVVVPPDLAEMSTRRTEHPEQGLVIDLRQPGDLPAKVVPDWLKASCACVADASARSV